MHCGCANSVDQVIEMKLKPTHIDSWLGTGRSKSEGQSSKFDLTSQRCKAPSL